MLKHIVMWKLKDVAEGGTRLQNAARMKSQLEGLEGPIPQIWELEVGLQMEPSDASYDLVLYSVFKSKSDLEVYQKHPEHQKVVEFVKKIVIDRKVVDYEV